jgi:hypothetical protein
MKKVIGLALVSLLVAGGFAAFAGGGDRVAGKAAASASCPVGAKLNLTAEQQARVAALMQECAKATSTSERRTMCEDGMQKILTPEQLTQWQATRDQAGKTGQCSTAGGAARKGCCGQ